MTVSRLATSSPALTFGWNPLQRKAKAASAETPASSSRLRLPAALLVAGLAGAAAPTYGPQAWSWATGAKEAAVDPTCTVSTQEGMLQLSDCSAPPKGVIGPFCMAQRKQGPPIFLGSAQLGRWLADLRKSLLSTENGVLLNGLLPKPGAKNTLDLLCAMRSPGQPPAAEPDDGGA